VEALSHTDVSQLSPDAGGFVPGFRHPILLLEEQRAIAVFLDRETVRIDTLIEKIGRSIDLLPEYRTAPVSAAVTGKIDVRKKVA
jgi:hypothetical protein